jgi:hypothetical protein
MAVAGEEGEHFVDRIRRAGDEQAAAGLRVAQQVALNVRHLAADHVFHRVPVAPRGAGLHAVFGEFPRAVEHRHPGFFDHQRHARATRHFAAMADQAEAGDIGGGVDALHGGKVRARCIEARRGGDHFLIMRRFQDLPLQRG